MFAKLRFEHRIDTSKVRREFLCKANREGIPGFEFALRLREMDLRNRLFVESLTRRRRVSGKESGVTLIEGGNLEPGQLLDA